MTHLPAAILAPDVAEDAEFLAGSMADTANRLNNMLLRLRKIDRSARLRCGKDGLLHVESRFIQYPDASGGFS